MIQQGMKQAKPLGHDVWIGQGFVGSLERFGVSHSFHPPGGEMVGEFVLEADARDFNEKGAVLMGLAQDGNEEGLD